MLRIVGRINSINVQKVVWGARELGLPFERTDIGGAFGGTDTPAYRAINPNGLVPVIDDDGFVLWESNAIVRYLAAGHGVGNLWPDSLKARADADRWMDWQATELGPTMRDAFIQLVRTTAEKRDQTKVSASTNASERLIGILDEHLAKRDYMTGRVHDGGHSSRPSGSSLARYAGLSRTQAKR